MNSLMHGNSLSRKELDIMDMKELQRIPVTVGITNFNGGEYVLETIKSIQKMDYPAYRIIVVDDCSSDDSVKKIQDHFPDVQIIVHEKNKGVSAVRNTIIRHAETNLIFIVDNDVIFDKSCLRLLVQEIIKRDDAVVVTPRVMLPDKMTIQSDGTKIHYIGAAIHYNRYSKIKEGEESGQVIEVECGSGGIMLLDKELAQRVNLFDEDFFFGWSDGEFFIRATLCGMRCYTVTSAKVFHIQKNWGTKRAFYQLRNRWYIILINYSLRTILISLPMLMLFEIFLLLMMVAKGTFLDLLRSWKSVILNFPIILRKRRIVQKNRVMKDRDFLKSGNITVDPGLMNKKLLLSMKQGVNGVYDIYWLIAMRLRLI